MNGGNGDDFDDFMGNHFGQQTRGKNKGRPVLKELSVTLEDIFSGKTLNHQHQKKVLCVGCKGKGGLILTKCSTCKGRGVVENIVRAGPMVFSNVGPCGKCNGIGETVKDGDKCKECNGECVKIVNKTLVINITKGMQHDEDIIIKNEGDEMPNVEAGDLYFRIKIKNHGIYKRHNEHVYFEKNITLLQALYGFSFEIKYLNNINLLISTSPGDITNPNIVKCIKGKGLYNKHTGNNGNIYIVFDIIFPNNNDLKGNLELGSISSISKFDMFKKLLPNDSNNSSLGPNVNGKNVEILQNIDQNDYIYTVIKNK
jgi:DnaJ-class molecular chaperone